jgi:hypothetical protein
MGRTTWLVGLVVLLGSCGTDSDDTDGSTGGTSATGGASSGGSSGSGGGESAGGTSSGGGSGESGGTSGTCEDCTLYSDCCSCLALGPAEDPPYCDPNIACLVDQCSALRITDADLRCLSGTCSLTVNCDATQVMCDMVEPTCPAGEVPSVEDNCYGPCVAEELCRD